MQHGWFCKIPDPTFFPAKLFYLVLENNCIKSTLINCLNWPCLEEYEDYIEGQPLRVVDPIGELRPSYPLYDYTEQQLCSCDVMISEFRKQMGVCGDQLIDAIQALDITNNKYSIVMHGKLLEYLWAYMTYKHCQMGNNYQTKVFNMAELKQKFSNSKIINQKIESFVSIL